MDQSLYVKVMEEIGQVVLSPGQNLVMVGYYQNTARYCCLGNINHALLVVCEFTQVPSKLFILKLKCALAALDHLSPLRTDYFRNQIELNFLEL